jgi:DNA-binding transcriptional LysR family regulator
MMLPRIAEPAQVCVGASQDHVDYVLPFAYSARYQRLSGIKVAVSVGPPQMTIPAAARGKLDFVITDTDGVSDRRLEHELLYAGQVFVVAAPGHSLAARDELTLADLVGYEWVIPAGAMEQQLRDTFVERGLPPPVVKLLASSACLRAGALAKSRLLGIHAAPTVLMRSEARSQLAMLPVKDFRWRCRVYAAYRSLGTLSAAARGLLAHLKAIEITPAEREEVA